MSGQLKEVRIRIRSVQNTQQITKAMKMVSAAKLRKAQEGIQHLRPYASKLKELYEQLAASLDTTTQTPLASVRPIQKLALVVLTSDKGLCGGYNVNIIKKTLALIEEKYAHLDPQAIEIISIGKKGDDFFRRRGYQVNSTYRDLFHKFQHEHLRACSLALIQAFTDKKYDAIELVYSNFKNAATQVMVSELFLPMQLQPQAQQQKASLYIYQPSQAVLLDTLLPLILDNQLLKAVLDATASEHGARMTAMDKATDNAQQMLSTLKISYNRARQAAITTELSEIVSGAAALEG